MRKRKPLIIAGVVGGSIITAATAWALLGGTVVLPDVAEGLALTSGASSCQTGGLTFTVPDPTWEPAQTAYVVTSLAYSGVSTSCVNLGTVDLEVRLVDQNTTLATATATDIGSSSGTMTLTPAVPFDDVTDAQYVYLVKG